MDWANWHRNYDDAASPLARRLVVVQGFLRKIVASHGEHNLRVMSLCAGDGRDILPVLADWGGRKAISGVLIELDPQLAARARAFAAAANLDKLEVICGDAARASNYSRATPADLLLACGVFGNVPDSDVRQFVTVARALCARDANVLWTRHRRNPDLTPRIRTWFAEASFEERDFESPGPDQFAVGWHQMTAAAHRDALPDPLFTFVR